MERHDGNSKTNNGKTNLLEKKCESSATVQTDGSIYIPERIVPLPESISEEAKLWLSQAKIPVAVKSENSFEDFRKEGDKNIKIISDRMLQCYPVNIRQQIIRGILCDCVEPIEKVPSNNQDKVIIALFGGMGVFGQNGLSEAIPMANLLRIKTIKPHYRLKPEWDFPANVNDVFAIYEELMGEVEAANIGILGASNGGVIAFQLMVKLLASNLPLPGAIASWGGGGMFAGSVDTFSTNMDLDPLARMNVQNNFLKWDEERGGGFASKVDPMDPYYAPIYADLSELPPVFLSSGTRDISLSQVVLMHQALREQGVEADLFVFEGMPHGFKFHCDLPEAKKLYKFTAEFFMKNLGFKESNG